MTSLSIFLMSMFLFCQVEVSVITDSGVREAFCGIWLEILKLRTSPSEFDLPKTKESH